MEGKTKKPMHRGHNEGNIRQRTDGRWEVRLSAGIDYKTGKPKRTSSGAPGFLHAAERGRSDERVFHARGHGRSGSTSPTISAAK